MKAFTRLKSWGVVEVSGTDSKDFLHRLSTANFKKLRTLEQTETAFLTPNGRLIAYGRAIQTGPDCTLIVTEFPTTTLCTELEKLHFVEQLSIRDRSNEFAFYRAVTSNDALPAATPTDVTTVTLDEWLSDLASSDRGYLVAATNDVAFEDSMRACGYVLEHDLELYRIAAGAPKYPNELSNTTNPLEARLDRAVHENKGCYPGQEVIERIRSIGNTPRLLHKFRSRATLAPPTVPTEILYDGVSVGQLTSAIATAEHGWIGVGFLKKTAPQPPTIFHVQDQEAETVS